MGNSMNGDYASIKGQRIGKMQGLELWPRLLMNKLNHEHQ